MASFNNFYSYAYGKVWDTDGNVSKYTTVQGYAGNLAGQCVSLIKAYLKWGGCGVKAYGNAIQFWTCRNSNGILQYCDVVSGSPRNGDIGISAGADPKYGHIFIYYNGQQFAQNVGGVARATLHPLSRNIYGYLRPKFITTYSDNQLINETAIATLTKDRIIKRKGNPTGDSAGELNSGTKIKYTQKWVGNGHRYISWLENGTRYFCAVSGSEVQGKDPWATFSRVNYNLIAENGTATLTVDGIRARLNSPTGDIVRTYNTGAKIKYTHKWIGNGHRYIVWNEGSNKIFLAISGSETQGKDPWATFGAESDEKKLVIIEENAVATLTKDGIRARLGSPTGEVVRSYNSGDKIPYTHKYIGNGHRYIVWTENNNKVFLAVSATEDRSEMWATFGSETVKKEEPKKENETKPETQNPEYVKNVKAHGIDISEHNGANFDVKGNDFVIIRASWGTHTDKLFETYVKKCEDAGIPYGVYCYGYPLNDNDAVSEAKYILDLIKDKDVKLGVWYDMEPDSYKEKNNTWNKSLCTSTCKAFCDYVKSKGYFTGVYSSSAFFKSMISTDYPKWIAQWKKETEFVYEDLSDQCDVFQYTSMGGKLDRDVLYKDIAYFASAPIKDEPAVEPKPEEPKEDVKPEPAPEPDKPNDSKENETDESKKDDSDNKQNNDEENGEKTLINLLIEFIKKILSLFK